MNKIFRQLLVDKNNNKKSNKNVNNFFNKKNTSNNKNNNWNKIAKWLPWVIFIIIIAIIIWALFFRSSEEKINNGEFLYVIDQIHQEAKEDSKSHNISYANGDTLSSLSFSRDNNGNYVVLAKGLSFHRTSTTPGYITSLSKGNYTAILSYDEGSYYSSNSYSQDYPYAGFIYVGDIKTDGTNKTTYTLPLEVQLTPASSTSFYLQLIFSLLPIIIIIILFYMVYRSFSKNKGGMSFGMPFKKSSIKPIKTNIKFRDVAGYKEEKCELEEVIDYLKRPNSYNSMGVRIPKGVLLIGEPGTGKTLLARAVAGESSVPFLKINGSEFVELFVGIGAQRVRDLFNTAKKYSPSILFIDEIDTIGRKRGSSLGGSNDEREQTLNQLLVELDGFSNRENVIVIGATNRMDVLDSALLRPGRFDRIIQFHTPTLDERVAILKVHSENKNLDPDIDLKQIAARTPGFTGAQLENVLNEAALLSIRDHEKMITAKDIDEAIDRTIGGLAKKSKKYIEKEKTLVSYHESGHAVCGLILDGADKIQKITIIPRGKAGGYTLMTPKNEKFFATKKEIIEKITGYLGGRASEEIMFGSWEITSGAHNDIEQATTLARKMVTELGMTELGMIKYDNLVNSQNPYFENTIKPSEKTAELIDNKIRSIIDDCYKKAYKIIKENLNLLKLLAKALMLQETINEEEIKYIYKNKKIPTSILKPGNKKESDLETIHKKHIKKDKIEINPT